MKYLCQLWPSVEINIDPKQSLRNFPSVFGLLPEKKEAPKN